MTVQYTARYENDGKSAISFASTTRQGRQHRRGRRDPAAEERGRGTKITLRQKLAPDTPVPTLLQGLIRGFVEKEAANAAAEYLSQRQARAGGRKKA